MKTDHNDDLVPEVRMQQYSELAKEKEVCAATLAVSSPPKYAAQVCIEGTPEAIETVGKVQAILLGEFDKATEGKEFMTRRQLMAFMAGVLDRCSEILKGGL